jgi:hypothetical protein
MLLLPQSEDHVPAVSLSLSDSLTRSGRHTLVMDIDVYHRQLSSCLPDTGAHGLLNHLLDKTMIQPYTLPAYDCTVIPIEASLTSATLGNYRQILNRLPQVWQRWPKSHIILDAAKWYPVYESLLPYVDRVITYPPTTNHKATTAITPPWALFQKKGIAITRLEALPDKLNVVLDEAGLNRLDRSLNPVMDR